MYVAERSRADSGISLKSYILLITGLFLFIFSTESAGGEYVSKQFVDTLIQEAYYRFTSIEENTLHAEAQQRRAISFGKNVVKKLEKLSKNDRNKQYIMFKVNELKKHIMTEERDLLLKQEKENKKEINRLCDRFNKETKKKRPNLSKLKHTVEEISEISTNKGNEFKWLYQKRARDLSNVIKNNLSVYIERGDYDKAQEELQYCYRNKDHLYITSSMYNRVGSIVNKHVSERSIVKGLEDKLDQISDALDSDQLDAARRYIETFNGYFQSVTDQIPYNKRIKIKREGDKLRKDVYDREEELVQKNLDILENRGVDAAVEFLEGEVRPVGVSRKKITMINNAILAVPSETDKTLDSLINSEISFIKEEDSVDGKSVVASVKNKAMKNVQDVRDSIKAEEDPNYRRNLRRRRIRERRAERRIDRLYRYLERGWFERAYDNLKDNRELFEEYADNSVHKRVKNDVVTAYKKAKGIDVASAAEKEKKEQKREKSNKNLKKKAKELTVEIYTLLDNEDVKKAYKRFTGHKSMLTDNLYQEAFDILDSTVYTRYKKLYTKNNRNDSKFKKNKRIAQEKVVYLYKLLEENKVEKAHQLFEKARPIMEVYLSKEVFNNLKNSISSYYKNL